MKIECACAMWDVGTVDVVCRGDIGDNEIKRKAQQGTITETFGACVTEARGDCK